jgi:hypothetical protein
MFLYLFLAATLVASTEETIIIEPELQEIVNLFTAEDTSSFVKTSADRPEALEDTLQQVQGEREKNESDNTRSIIITNAIQPSMLAYKHWTGTYNPDKFTISVNGAEVAQGAQHTLSATTDPVDIRFDYSFVNGKRTGSHVISYQLDENIAQANITFSWNDEWKIIVDNGKPVKHEEIKV